MSKKRTRINLLEYRREELYTEFYKCTRCKFDFIMSDFKLCPVCGSKIKWYTPEKKPVNVQERKITFPNIDILREQGKLIKVPPKKDL